MSLVQRRFFVIANKVLGPKLYRTPQTVKKYQHLYPGDLTVEEFDNESQALIRLSSLKKEYERTHILEETLSKRKRQEQSLNLENNEQKTEKTSENNEKKMEEIKSEYSIFYHFKDNEDLLKVAQSKIEPSSFYHLFFDGASKYNPGPSGCGYALFSENSQKIYYNSLYLGAKTNNQAEYLGLIYGMKSALNLGIHKLHCYGDSELVIKQMKGIYALKAKQLLIYNSQAHKLRKEFKSVEFTSIDREDNIVANKLAVDGRGGGRKKI